MSARKRQYQPTLDSFFGQKASRSAVTTCDTDYQPLGAPTLPEAVQSSLLSVGMRIRKAVPEGYKTHKTALFDDSTVPCVLVSSQPKSARKVTELAPFCGLHKVGGLGVQSIPVLTQVRLPGQRYEQSNEEEWRSLPSTQESITREADPSTAGKRRHEEDEDQDDLFANTNTINSPLFNSANFGLGIFGFGQPDENQVTPTKQRVIAKPRPRLHHRDAVLMETSSNLTRNEDMDFGEATFLRQDSSNETMEMGYS